MSFKGPRHPGDARRAGTRPDRRSHGFTLLEIVIALGLLVLLAALAIMSAAAVTNSWSRLESRQQQFAELMLVDRTLDGLLTNIVPMTWPNADGDRLPCFSGGSNWLRFAYRHRVAQPSEGALRFVLLEVADGKLRAFYDEHPPFDGEQLRSQGRVSVLAEGVASLSLQYAVIRRNMTPDDPPEWLQQWIPEEWPQRDRLQQRRPLALRLVIEWQDGRVENWLRRLPGNSQYERRGQWQPLSPDL